MHPCIVESQDESCEVSTKKKMGLLLANKLELFKLGNGLTVIS